MVNIREFFVQSKLTAKERKQISDVFSFFVIGEKFNFNEKDVEGFADKVLEKYQDFLEGYMSRQLKLTRPRVEMFKLIEESKEVIKGIIEEYHECLSNKYKLDKPALFIDVFSAVKKIFIEFDRSYYYEWGFTPAISEIFNGLNCAGFVQVLGGALLRAGFDVKMAQGINHPFCYLDFGEHKYVASLYGIHPLTESLVDGINHIEIEGVREKLLMVTDFKTGVAYDIFENFRAYQDQLAGKRTYELIDLFTVDKEGFMSFLKPSLQGINWERAQAKVFPELRKLYDDNAKLYEEEYKQMEEEYGDRDIEKRISFLLNFYYKEMFMTQNNIGDRPFTEAEIIKFKEFAKDESEKLKKAFELYAEDVIKLFDEDKKLGLHVPQFLQTFIYNVKDTLDQMADQEKKKKMVQRFLQPAYDYIVMNVSEEKAREMLKNAEEEISKPIIIDDLEMPKLI